MARRKRLDWEDVDIRRFVVSSDEPGPEIHDYLVQKISGLGRRAQVRRHRLGREGIMNLVGLGFGVSELAPISTGQSG